MQYDCAEVLQKFTSEHIDRKCKISDVLCVLVLELYFLFRKKIGGTLIERADSSKLMIDTV